MKGPILVTGGAGSLARALAAVGGVRVRALARSALDITDRDAVERALLAHRPACVINAAAMTDVDAAERAPEAATAVNGVAPGRLAALCRAAGAALIHISTDYVFSGGPGPWREDDEARPENHYGASKREGERAALAEGGAVCVARVAWLFGGADDFPTRMLTRGRSDPRVRIVAQHGSPTPIAPLAERLLALADRLLSGAQTPPILHMAGSPPTSRADWVREVFDAARARGMTLAEIEEVALEAFPTPARRPSASALDTRLSDALFGPIPWRPAAQAIGAAFAEKAAP